MCDFSSYFNLSINCDWVRSEQARVWAGRDVHGGLWSWCRRWSGRRRLWQSGKIVFGKELLKVMLGSGAV